MKMLNALIVREAIAVPANLVSVAMDFHVNVNNIVVAISTEPSICMNK